MNLSNIFTYENLVHLIDILVVWFVLYNVANWVRGTRAMQLVRGIVILIVVRLVAWWVGLETISWFLDQIINWGPIALVVLFQQEIRRALENLGTRSFFRPSGPSVPSEEIVMTALDQALPYLSRRRIGALIAIEQKTSLSDIIETGITLDARVSSALLINTFIPNTPLHDGAAVIRADRLVAATAYLPLSSDPTTSKDLGTRHRAGLGLAESTDAIVIIVSEETGEVSVAHKGVLHRSLKPEQYDQFLRERLIPENEKNQSDVFANLTSWVVGPKRKGNRNRSKGGDSNENH
ncbi:MAG: diadenylate cyclase CdaA [Oenococcus sp.]|uniref:diadenylate cyclase CdaA n=1 Tax=Oenococcus sp. TaxID=1979414 RepID=UPI0039EA2467